MQNRSATSLVVAAISAALSLSGIAVVATTSSAFAADEQVVLSRGHVDAMEVTFDPATDKPRLLVKDDTELFAGGKVFRKPEDVTIDIDDEQAAFEVSADLGAEYAFLGEPGDVVYMVPEVQNPELPWPGWSTERLQASVPAGITLASGQDAVELNVAVTGPGAVHTFMSGPFGEVINHYVDTTDANPDDIPVGTNNHVHTTWVFAEQGNYVITVTPTVKTSGGIRLTGSPSAYKFHVGDPLAPITPVTPPGSEPKILGTPAVGTELYATDGDWKPAPTEYTSRQWFRDGAPIPGATDNAYTVTPGDVGHQLTFTSTVRIGRTTATSASSPLTVLGPAPSNTTKPAINGNAQFGGLLTASPGTWSATGLTYGYQWLRNSAPIPGATKQTYRPVVADVSRNITVRVSARGTGTAIATVLSPARAIRPGAALRPTTRPQVTGVKKVGRTLTVRYGKWTPAATSYAVQWKVGGKLLANKSPRLKLARAHKGKKVTVTVIARRPGHLDGRATLAAGKIR